MMRNYRIARAGFAMLVGVWAFAAVALAAPPKHNVKSAGKPAAPAKVLPVQLTDGPKLETIVRGKAGSVVLLNIWAST